jgi:hypothetical protein
MRILASLIIMAALSQGTAEAQIVIDTSSVTRDASRILRHEVVIAAPVADAYDAFATMEGWRSWAVPFASLAAPGLAIDAEFETAYSPSAALGDDTNIRQRVLAFLPERMFAFQTVRAPKGFPHPEEIRQVFSVVELEPVDRAHTRVRLSMIGYRTGAAFDDLYNTFAKGNAWSLAKLAERFETGPIDWKKALAKPAH